MAASYLKTPVLESLFSSEYCKVFQSTYFEEHLQAAASENVFIKTIKRINFKLEKTQFFQYQYRKQVKMLAFVLFHDWFPVKFVFIHIQYFFGM